MVNKIAASAVAMFVALGMAAPASALTSAELSAIAAVLGLDASQVSALQALVSDSSSSTGSTTMTGGYTYSMTLRSGMSGQAVVDLQNALISAGYAVGAVDGSFGPATRAAVMQFQAANALGADGVVGPATASALNAATATTVVTNPGNGGSDDGDNGSTGSDFDQFSGEEVSIEDEDSEYSDLEEGDTNEEFAMLEFKAIDSSMLIERIDVYVDDHTTDFDATDAFTEISVYINDDKVASNDDVNKSSAWVEKTISGDDFLRLRFSGVDTVVEEGDTAVISVRADVDSSIPDISTGFSSLDAAVEVRGVDGAGLTQYAGGDTDSSFAGTFDIDPLSEAAIKISASSDNPDSAFLAGDDNGVSDWYTVLVFEMEIDDHDVSIDDITFDVDTTVAANVDALVDDIKLKLDGTTYTKETWTNDSTSNATVEFDIDGDMFDKDQTIEGEIMVRFEEITSSLEGSTIQVSLDDNTTKYVDAEGDSDLSTGSGNDISGDATGDAHTVLVDGMAISLDSVGTPVVSDYSAGGTDYVDSKMSVVFNLNVDDFEDEVYLPKAGADAFDVVVMNASTNAAYSSFVTGPTVSVQSNADDNTSSSFFDINGAKDVTVTVTFVPQAAGDYYVELSGVNFTASDVAAGGYSFATDTDKRNLSLDDYESGVASVNAGQ